MTALSRDIQFRRLCAVLGIIAAISSVPAIALWPMMKDAFDPARLPAGLTALAADPSKAVFCQLMWVLSNTTMMLWVWGIASLERESSGGRDLAWLGAVLVTMWTMSDNSVAVLVIAVARRIAPHAMSDPAMKATGLGLLNIVTALDSTQAYFWMVGSAAFAVWGWRSRVWPRWLTGIVAACSALALLSFFDISLPLPGSVSTALSDGLPSVWIVAGSILLWKTTRDAPMAHAANARIN